MSVLRNALDFLGEFGIFDVILPFLLVFAVVFGILEKTRILGEEKIGKETYPRKNLNAIVAFVLAMLVVAATKIVGVINTALPQVSLLIIVALSFLLMIGIFMKPDNTLYEKLSGRWMVFLMIIMFVGVISVFLGNIPANEKQSWLGFAFNYVLEFWSGTLVATLILLGVVIWAIIYITKGDEGRPSAGKE
ncbi:hypothetical protein J4443_03565 [Candidatus Woesearchaeota archaeon]|nr:hypothetical protein [Candidatus Woesearchaeota archaeon]